MADRKQPTRVAAPKIASSELSRSLAAITKASKKRGSSTGIRRASKNPSKVGVDETLKVVRAGRGRLPSVSEIMRDTAVTVGEGPRLEGVPRAGQAYDDILLGGADQGPQTAAAGPLIEVDGELIPDRTEYLSPPPSIDPDRPRAREAKYNPDTRQLHVVFRNGGTYVYYDVPTTTWRALKRNRSFGQTLDRLVMNQYAYEKVAF